VSNNDMNAQATVRVYAALAKTAFIGWGKKGKHTNSHHESCLSPAKGKDTMAEGCGEVGRIRCRV